ncbi:unnamed protein product, partial [Scytosiphon promiscuus]
FPWWPRLTCTYTSWFRFEVLHGLKGATLFAVSLFESAGVVTGSQSRTSGSKLLLGTSSFLFFSPRRTAHSHASIGSVDRVSKREGGEGSAPWAHSHACVDFVGCASRRKAARGGERGEGRGFMSLLRRAVFVESPRNMGKSRRCELFHLRAFALEEQRFLIFVLPSSCLDPCIVCVCANRHFSRSC